MELENINIREEHYADVHDMKPKWWMRWGIMTVFVILTVLVFLGYIVKYPDVIRSDFKLTTNKPSVTLPIFQGQQISVVLKKNYEEVIANEPIIVLANESNYKDVLFLHKELKQFSFRKEDILLFFDKYLEKSLQLGNLIESDWISFSNELLEYYKIVKLDSYQSQISFLKKELQKQRQLQREYIGLTRTDKKQEVLIKEKIKSDSVLYSKGVISRIAFNTNKRVAVENIKALKQDNLALKRVNLEIIRLTNTIENQENNEVENLLSRRLGIRKSLNRLLSSIELWKRKNLVTSPIKGTVNFIQDIKAGGFYEGNTVVITPKNTSFYALAQVPFIGAGKIENKQRTVLKLNDYPYREYGVINGNVSELNTVSGEKFYLAKVVLNENKLSSYGKQIELQENMTGVCEIITKDRSILQRVFEKVTYAFTR
ncbi:hypothetical protein [uncultured Tenacibaculum sp.]|uniref:hypothetical protein n=1 Tax=uncultured Tenacibaculum sp. TaxID=174713 RepID=UPI00263106E8|nr:hypothetical protein [uncultured Tenacibaculum sp.]